MKVVLDPKVVLDNIMSLAVEVVRPIVQMLGMIIKNKCDYWWGL